MQRKIYLIYTMRIAFLGKGGSGKTTSSAGFIQYINNIKGMPVIAVDADVNVHLKDMLGFESDFLPIGDKFREVAQYLVGSRSDVRVEHIVATTPPSLRSNFITADSGDVFIKKYATQKNGLKLLTIGNYEAKDVGHTCYHGKLNTLELIYHHFLDSDNDILVADATAGTDNLGTSLYFAYDINIFVVEPTTKSINVYLDFERSASGLGLKTRVLVNKAQENDRLFVEQYISPEKIIGYLPASHHIREYEQGNVNGLSKFIHENQSVYGAVYELVRSNAKSWDSYYQTLLTIHKRNSLEWWNSYLHQAIDQQGEPDFSYQKAIDLWKKSR